MDEHTLVGDAFAVPDLWKKSTLTDFDGATPLHLENIQALSSEPLQLR